MALLFFILIYAYIAFSVQTIAERTGTENEWYAWVPIANIYLMCQIAGRPTYWVLLFFIPLVNLVIAVVLWMGVAQACGKPQWIGLLILVPIANLIMPGYLAFSK